jgi:integrase
MGMREGELISLEWGDVDFENSVIRIRRKPGGMPKSIRRKIPGIWGQSPQKFDDHCATGRLVTTTTQLVALRMLIRPFIFPDTL